jgi:phage FluMu protein Com
MELSGKVIDITNLLPIWETNNYRCGGCKKKWVSVNLINFIMPECPYCKDEQLFYYKVKQ